MKRISQRPRSSSNAMDWHAESLKQQCDYRTSTSIITHRPRNVSYRPYSVSERKCTSSICTSTDSGGFSILRGGSRLISGAFCLRPQNDDFAAGGGVDLSGRGSTIVGRESDSAMSSCVLSSSMACCCVQNSSVSWPPSSWMGIGVSSDGKPTSCPLRLASADISLTDHVD